ncbi:hypothetical protein ALIPUT_02246 [Alistipes putredinis DSM 17216]|uniref:Uncharacterized protein n=1 Tax=Alistipes putredinis DSM 17216 TaxID=445970 RepID=B0MYN0_9BACT|nr:hypothetical protein ALIPUT_02246 [Alistipes putredinis DSM 17216]
MAGPALFRAGPFLICFCGGYDGNTSVGDTAAKAVGMRRSDAKIVNFPVYSGV